ncbi:hypothetical protein B0J13DRAFT_653948 [Dactylonectria estremocensis]|uniref:Uncharacterized protein n=1 Tax=Dactylonectria estremocensis TaxID=1079267 RepID=A0A9P9DAD3_9HYPO|nr:hypothetical protein B0J13DRAFT_653948 [Dactylonectria estremocensis]
MKSAYMKSKARHEHAITASFLFKARGEYLEKSILGIRNCVRQGLRKRPLTPRKEAAKQFNAGPEREFAQKFADSFLDSWNQALTDAKSAPIPTYSNVVASPPAANNALTHQSRHHQQYHQQQQQQTSPHRQGQATVGAPPREDLRVFIRLDAGAPARAHKDYAIRTHISRKLGVDPRKIPRVLQVRSGWAVLTADITTRDLLVQKTD